MIKCGVGRDTTFLSDEVIFTGNRVNPGCTMILRYIPAKTAKHQNSRPRPTVGRPNWKLRELLRFILVSYYE